MKLFVCFFSLLIVQDCLARRVVYCEGVTPLMYAVSHNDSSLVAEILYGDVDVNERDAGGLSALCYATTPEMIRLLVDWGANPNIVSLKGYSPLMFHVLHKDFEPYSSSDLYGVLNSLVENGADVNLKNRRGQSVFILAAVMSDDSNVLFQLRLLGADINLRDSSGYSALDYVCVERGWEKNNAKQDLVGCFVRTLVCIGADVNSRDSRGMTALLKAVEKREFNRLSVFETLVKNGADVNVVGSNGENVLALVKKYHSTRRAVKKMNDVSQLDSELDFFIKEINKKKEKGSSRQDKPGKQGQLETGERGPPDSEKSGSKGHVSTFNIE